MNKMTKADIEFLDRFTVDDDLDTEEMERMQDIAFLDDAACDDWY